MKIIVEFSIEIAMIVSTAYENYNNFMIMDFSALIVVNYIDLYYCQSLSDDELKTSIEKAEYSMPYNQEKRKESTYKCHDKLYAGAIKMVKVFYEIIYFHFFPYIAIAYSYYAIT